MEHSDYQTFKGLRKAHKLTQRDLAEKLERSPSTISLMERQSDLLLAILRKNIEAVGGTIKFTVHSK